MVGYHPIKGGILPVDPILRTLLEHVFEVVKVRVIA